MKVLTQSFVIILSTFIVFVIVNTGLSDYVAQILALIVIIWMVILLIRRIRGEEEIFKGSSFDIFVIMLGILMIIFLTGGLSSQIFFLLYFLLFGITFMFEPATIFVFVASLLFLFGQEALSGNLFQNLLMLGSLLLLSPLAFFFGIEFKKRESLHEKMRQETHAVIKDRRTVLRKNSLDEEEIDEIEDIYNKAEKLKKDS